MFKYIIKSFAAAFFISSAALFSSCSEEKPAQQQSNTQVMDVAIATAKNTEVPSTMKFSGALASGQQAKLSTKIMGMITELKVREGDLVQKGQVIAQLRSTDLQASQAQVAANMAEAEAALANAQKDFERIKTLHSQKSATQKELDDVTTGVEMAKARVEAIRQMKLEVQANLAYATIAAPFTGFITRKFMQQGDLATPGMPIVSIESSSEFKVVARIPESLINQVTTGAKVTITMDALPELVLEAQVDQINPSGGYSGAQYEVTAHIYPEDAIKAKLKSGMYTAMHLTNGTESRLLVPMESLTQRGQLTGLFAVNQQGQAMLRWVRTGKTFGDKIEILSGLSEGEQYILTPGSKMADGQRVAAR